MMNKICLIMCVVSLAKLCLAQEASVNFISPPQTKNPGEDVTFKCAVSKPKEVLVQWLKDGRAITLGGLLAFNDPRLKIEVDEHENSYSLTVKNLTAGDTGKYRCQINLELDRTIGKDADLQVTRAPVILDSAETIFPAVEAQAVVLLCNADGFPKPEITWKRDNNDLMSNKLFEYKGANLTILRVKKEDRGRYICEASNGIGNKVSKAVLLEVSFAPSLSTKRPKVGQKEGYQARLTCKSTSYPPASISFLRDDKELNNNEHYQIEYLGIGNGETEAILTFHQVTRHHYGVYLCRAKNAFGNAETQLELFEQEIPNEIFSMLMQSSGHRFIGFHHCIVAVIGAITLFKLFY